MSALCPICQKNEAVRAYRPFCSRRCADVDLNRWLGAQYRIASTEPVDIVAGVDEDENLTHLN